MITLAGRAVNNDREPQRSSGGPRFAEVDARRQRASPEEARQAPTVVT
jgi:hypothetical protein